jgi:hypothetical protein
MRIIATARPLVVRFRLNSQTYSSQDAEATGEFKPFDETVVPAYQTFELVDGSIVGIEELGGAPQQGGTPD